MSTSKIDLTNVPNNPGVYLWKNEFGDVIYVGKAKNLNKRMKQYFKGMLNSYKTAKMVEQIHSFDYVIVQSDKEALILEKNLIEKHVPEFNIKLTDDKRYPYIKVKLTDKLDISLAYRVRTDRDKAIYFGPFPTGYGAKKMANFISRETTFKNGLPFSTNDKEYWREQYNEAKQMLSPKSKGIIPILKKEMEEAAENMQFEVAQDIKETISALSSFSDKQSVEFVSNKDTDVIAFVEKDGYLSVAMLFYRKGMLLSKNNFILEIASDKEETMSQFVSQYYAHNFTPNEIISNKSFTTSIELTIPQKGTKKKILKIAMSNAKDNIDLRLQEFIRKEELTLGAIKKLSKILGMKNLNHILMIDNSNTNNSLPVSAIVSYRNGIKQKHEYKKYNLIHNERQADVDYMKQGTERYFKNTDNNIPDLFIVDGGIQQINEVKNLIPNGVTLIGLVKDEKHTTREIITSNNKAIKIEDQSLMNFLKNIQVEVDRFAKTHHTKRRKTTLEGLLMTVPGIGKSTEKKLLDHFKSYSAIYNATLKDLEEVVNVKLAKEIKKTLERK